MEKPNERDIVNIIKSQFEKKRERNKSYSLRAFAIHLDIDPSLLSRILNRKIPITNQMLIRIYKKIQINDVELFEIQTALIKERLDPKNKWGIETFFESEDLEKFKLIQTWYYLPIVELFHLYPKNITSAIISKKLNIEEEEAKEALRKLKSLGIIEKNKSNKWVPKLSYQALLEKNLFSNAMKGRQREIFHKAADDVVGMDDKCFEQCSFAMAIDDNLVEEARMRIHNFKKKLALDLNKKSKKKNSVYEFSFSFFPLAKKEE